MRAVKMAVLAAVAMPLLAVMALLAPSATAATSPAVLSASHMSVQPSPDAPFPSCGDSFRVQRLGSGSRTVRVVGTDLNQYLRATKKVWVTDTGDSEVYGPYSAGNSISVDIITNGTSPTTFAIELTTEENETLCADDYYALYEQCGICQRVHRPNV